MSPVGVDIATVEMISKMKLIPMTPNIKKAPTFGKVSLTPLCKNGWKNSNAETTNIPVLIIGTNKEASINPTTRCLFFNKLKTKPAIKPASVVFNKQVTIVPATLMGIKMAKVDGENKTITPLKKPNIAPDNGPYNTAAMTIVTSDKLILTGPNCK